ncbi:MAG TPA: polysaccharide deacetylase family protein [Chloroflexota bacterium]|nr:polysaccharide deacetylase family protein [Chloroflexota bacterium]
MVVRGPRRRVLACLSAAAARLAFPRTAHLAPLGGDGAIDLLDPAALAGGDYVGWVDVPRYFPETGHNVDGDFLTHFWAHGATETFGLPLTEAYWTPGDDEDGAGVEVQYFQRARLELDLATGELRLSALGTLLEKQQPAVPPEAGVRYFPQTGHNVGRSFLVFFEQAGGIDALGLPLSEEVEEYGRPVQWFERARLEWWPERRADQRVQLGLIGEAHLEAARDEVPEEALAAAAPLPPLREWSLPAPPPPPRVAWAPADIPILYYHQIPSAAALRTQLVAFREGGRQIVSLARAVAALRGEGPALPDKPLVLTFDDGWETQFHNAAPVLQAEGVPATFFVITRFLGQIPGYMSWDQVRTLKELGHDIESHTQNHPSVDKLYAEDAGAALAELWESLAVLERRLGHSQRLFAYPNGTWNKTVADLAARVYRAAVATAGGTFQSQPQLYQMRRIKAEPHYRPADLLKLMP